MRKIFVSVGIVIIVLASAIYFFEFKNNGKKSGDLTDFNIIFRYGTSGRYGIDTFENLIYKDRVAAGVAEGGFRISDGDKFSIRQKMGELRLKDIDPLVAWTRNLCPLGAPPDSFYLKVQDGDNVWEKSWRDCEKDINPRYQEFADFMEKMIESKWEYKLLPGPVGGYM